MVEGDQRPAAAGILAGRAGVVAEAVEDRVDDPQVTENRLGLPECGVEGMAVPVDQKGRAVDGLGPRFGVVRALEKG
jgi:hypothetical protein